NLFGEPLDLLPFPAMFVLPGIRRLDGLDKVVHGVGLHVGQTPGMMIGDADDHRRATRKCDSRNVFSIYRKMAGIPDGGQAEAEMRIAAQNRFAGGGPHSIDGPVVASETAGISEPALPGQVLNRGRVSWRGARNGRKSLASYPLTVRLNCYGRDLV